MSPWFFMCLAANKSIRNLIKQTHFHHKSYANPFNNSLFVQYLTKLDPGGQVCFLYDIFQIEIET